ncbi:MAG: hypothetical protein IH983_00170 [Planctomycetes bacterium]|nr:hypothetical protein [Planctomycetota bacterium]
MDQKEYEMLKARAQEQFKASLRRARALRDEELAAIERVRVLSQEASGDRSPPPVSAPAQPTTLIGQVRAAVAALSDRFTVNDVAEYIRAVYGEETQKVRGSSISSALGRLSDAEEITILREGIGRRPTTYSPRPPEENNVDK